VFQDFAQHNTIKAGAAKRGLTRIPANERGLVSHVLPDGFSSSRREFQIREVQAYYGPFEMPPYVTGGLTETASHVENPARIAYVGIKQALNSLVPGEIKVSLQRRPRHGPFFRGVEIGERRVL
jgi:hypothetical protein